MIAARPPTPTVALSAAYTVLAPAAPSAIAMTRSLPLCEWPDWPHYNGSDAKNATS